MTPLNFIIRDLVVVLKDAAYIILTVGIELTDDVQPNIPSEPVDPVVYMLAIKHHKIKETNLPPELQVLLTEEVLKALWCFLKKNFCLKDPKCGEPVANVLDSLNVDVPDVVVGAVVIHYIKENHEITVDYNIPA